MPIAVPPGSSSFRLTRSFATVGGLVMVSAALLLSGFHWYWALGEMEEMAEQNNVNVAQLLSNVLLQRDATRVEALSALDPRTLKGRPEIAALRDEVLTFIRNAPVYRLKIYGRNGQTLFSTDAAQIGEDESDDAGFQSARRGVVASELARKNTFSVFESTVVDRDLLSSYVPIYRPGADANLPGGDVIGVFEVYDDVTGFLRDINRGIASQVALVLLITGAAYLVLIWTVRRGDLLLRREHARSLALVESVARAEAASKAKTQFLANMSHELRTPLNSVIGFAEVLSTESLGPIGDERYRAYAKEIADAGRNLLTIINNTLDLSRLELGATEVVLRPVDPQAVIAGVLHSLAPEIEEAKLAISVEIDPQLPPFESDEAKLRQILLNLVSNAVKFTPAGGRVAVRVGAAQRTMVRLEVADSGIGLAPEHVPIALAPFGQVDAALNRRYQGAGLGLPLAKGLAERLGGTLDIVGAAGAGTVVGVTLPAAG